jgi:hypothetical protein
MDRGCRARESAPGQYQPRRPSRSVLYRCVQEDFESWLAQCRYGHDDEWSVPEYVERGAGTSTAACPWLRPRPLRTMRPRLPDRLLVQGSRGLPLARRDGLSSHGEFMWPQEKRRRA